jgi:hypothetical protein
MDRLHRGEHPDVFQDSDLATRAADQVDLEVVARWAELSRPELRVVTLGRLAAAELAARERESEHWLRIADEIGRTKPDVE